jgi:lipid II:glycine glycyltransferase (peptidoglycan interpeptide bridge formation enzyme)
VAGSFVVLVKDTGERKERSMRGRNYLRDVAAALAAFVASLVWYTVFGEAMVELRGVDPSAAANTATPAWAMLFVIAQSLVVASVLAYLVSHL